MITFKNILQCTQYDTRQSGPCSARNGFQELLSDLLSLLGIIRRRLGRMLKKFYVIINEDVLQVESAMKIHCRLDDVHNALPDFISQSVSLILLLNGVINLRVLWNEHPLCSSWLFCVVHAHILAFFLILYHNSSTVRFQKFHYFGLIQALMRQEALRHEKKRPVWA